MYSNLMQICLENDNNDIASKLFSEMISNKNSIKLDRNVFDSFIKKLLFYNDTKTLKIVLDSIRGDKLESSVIDLISKKPSRTNIDWLISCLEDSAKRNIIPKSSTCTTFA